LRRFIGFIEDKLIIELVKAQENFIRSGYLNLAERIDYLINFLHVPINERWIQEISNEVTLCHLCRRASVVQKQIMETTAIKLYLRLSQG